MLTDIHQTEGVWLSDTEPRFAQCFTHPLAEYRALTEHAGIIDLSHWGAIRLTGSDREAFLNNMITNDVVGLKVGHACHAAMTTVKGKLVAELYVLKRKDELFVLVSQGDTAAVVAALDKHIIADDVELTDVSDQFGVLSIEGPGSRELAWRIFPDGPLPLDALTFGEGLYQETHITVLRNGVTGDKAMQMIIGVEGLGLIRNYLVQAGRGIDSLPVGQVAWNIRRVENGMPWFGPDVTTDNFPKEARLDDVVNYEKGCYLGQETLARMHYRGHPNWLLVGLTPTGDLPEAWSPPAWMETPSVELPTVANDLDVVKAHADQLLAGNVADGAQLFEHEEEGSETATITRKAMGRITSAVLSPKTGRPLFLGYVRHTIAEPGKTLIMQTDTQSVPVQDRHPASRTGITIPIGVAST